MNKKDQENQQAIIRKALESKKAPQITTKPLAPKEHHSSSTSATRGEGSGVASTAEMTVNDRVRFYL